MPWDREKGLKYLNSPAFAENTYENIRRNAGFTDDNNSGSTADEEEDYLRIIREIREKGDRLGWDKGGSSDPNGYREYDMMDRGPTSPRRVGGFGDRDVGDFLRDYVSPEEGDNSPHLENIPRMTDFKEVELDTMDSKARQLEAALREAQHRSFSDMMRQQPAAMDGVFGNSYGSYAR